MEIKDKYLKLKELLDENKKWPMRYMFKFIVPNNNGKVDAVKELMPKHGKINFKHTNNLKYVSITSVASMKSAEAIISITQQAEDIEGVISL